MIYIVINITTPDSTQIFINNFNPYVVLSSILATPCNDGCICIGNNLT